MMEMLVLCKTSNTFLYNVHVQQCHNVDDQHLYEVGTLFSYLSISGWFHQKHGIHVISNQPINTSTGIMLIMHTIKMLRYCDE